jgi:hypothetical protein
MKLSKNIPKLDNPDVSKMSKILSGCRGSNDIVPSTSKGGLDAGNIKR